MTHWKTPIVIIFFLALISPCQAQILPINKLDSLAGRLVNTLRAMKQEKIYLKTDRAFYSPGDKVWFRSFLVDQYTGKLSAKNNMLFVDLVDEKDSVIQKALLQASQFKTDGSLALSDTMATGFYWLRAYTKELALHHPDQAGIQPLYIFNALKPGARNIQPIKSVEADTVKLRMDFFPEGGTVVGGTVTTIAFRITNAKGHPQQMTGFVKDDHDSLVTSFQSNKYGLGKMSFFSWSWRKYAAHLKISGEPDRIFSLPAINPFAAQLAIVDTKGLKKLRVVLEDSMYKKDMKTYIIGLSGDSLCFAGIGTGSYEVNIPEYRFPYGVADFLLFDEQQHLLSERKLFISANPLQVAVVPDKALYAARQKAQLDISVTHADSHPVVSSMLVSIKDSSIAGNLQLWGEGKLPDELPDINQWTLIDQSYDAEELDLMLMTQNSSFKKTMIELARLTGNKSLGQPTDSSFYIKGKISDNRTKPIVNKIVTLFSGAKNMFAFTDTTDANGEFCFPLTFYYDQTKFNIQVTDKKGFPVESKIELDTLFRFPRYITPAYRKQKFTVEGVKEFYTNQRKRSVQDTIIMGKDWLKEVIVRTTIKKPSEFNRDKRVSSFSKILTGKNLQNGGNNNVGDALFRIPGLTLRNGFLVIRGGNSFQTPSAADEPLLIVDGVAVTPQSDSMIPGSPLVNFLNTFSFRSVDFIEVLSGAEAAYFGTRAFNGVILIHTKTTQTDLGDAPSNGIKSFVMPGYQVPVAFEQPDYSLKENRNARFPDRRTLLYWNGDVITDEKGKVSLDFYTADQPARYYVTVTGITADGRLVNKQVTVNRK